MKSMKIIQNTLKIEEKFSDVPKKFRVGPEKVGSVGFPEMRNFFRGPYYLTLSALLYPGNRVLGGFTVFSMSVIQSSCQHLRVLLYDFDSLCPILFKFTPHLDQQRMHV